MPPVSSSGRGPRATPPGRRLDAASLGSGFDAASFVARDWQRRARLVRAALPGFDGLFDIAALRALAERDDVESRLVVRRGARYEVSHGPFPRGTWRDLPARNWTLLVQGTNLHDRRADALMRLFAFLPYARLDDVMVSYAAPGGGVGPHVDSYDVFLLQGRGRRRWRYGVQRDLSLRPGLPLRILSAFTPTHDEVLGPGDMLYLPPRLAHDGVAVDTCSTYSIGFRAPEATEFAQALLDFLRDRVALPGRYADPGIAATRHPARLDGDMLARYARLLKDLTFDARTVRAFVGSYLSEPKPDVFFTPPARPGTRAAFARRAARRGVALDIRTQLLYDAGRFYINGAQCAAPRGGAVALRKLADRRALDAKACAALAPATLDLLHGWYRDGFLDTES